MRRNVQLCFTTCLWLLPLVAIRAVGINDGVLAHYELNGDANDTGTNALHGTVFGAQAITNRFDATQQALHFDGDGDYLDLGAHTTWTFGTNSFSISFWFNPDQIAPRKVGLITLQNSSSDIELSIGYGTIWATPETPGDKLALGINYSGTGLWPIDLIGSTSLSTGIWHHVTLTRNGQTWSTYLDGQVSPELSTTYDFSGGAGTLVIGTHIPTDRFFQGDMDDIRIYERALTTEEISTLADHPVTDLWTAIEIGWLSVSGIVYQVQWADSLNSNIWYNVGDPVIGNGSSNNVFHGTRGEKTGFYRITSP